MSLKSRFQSVRSLLNRKSSITGIDLVASLTLVFDLLIGADIA
ncbi:hypothetical protein [Nostoc sp. WHI]|nr:hypothetical protein [Nostoc sp. WHI]